MIVGIDFDGTCVTHDFPRIGREIGSERVLKRLIEAGHKLILFTMRSDKKDVSSDDYEIHAQSGNYLSEAIEWFRQRNIPLYGVNENPTQRSWTDSPKPYCHLYIDDMALGCPLIYPYRERPYVDWSRVELLMESLGYLQKA